MMFPTASSQCARHLHERLEAAAGFDVPYRDSRDLQYAALSAHALLFREEGLPWAVYVRLGGRWFKMFQVSGADQTLLELSKAGRIRDGFNGKTDEECAELE